MSFEDIDQVREYAYSEFENIRVDDINDKGQYCYIFFSSNGLCDASSVVSYEQSIIKNNKYEWTSIAKTIEKQKDTKKCIYVRDVYMRWYINGTSRRIDDIDKLLCELQKLCEGSLVITVGISSGGYMSTIAGIFLNAYKIYNISGQFDLSIHIPEVYDEFVRKSSKYGSIVDLIKEYSKEKDSDASDIYYFCPIGCDHDRNQYELVKDIPCVKSFIFPFKMHASTVYPFSFPDLLTMKRYKLDRLFKKYSGLTINKNAFLFDTMTALGWSSFFVRAAKLKMDYRQIKFEWDVKKDDSAETNKSGINLYILGNGFDLAHNLNTGYSCFRNFLIEKCRAYGIDITDENGELVSCPPRLPFRQIHMRNRVGGGVVLAEYEREAALLLWLIEKEAKNRDEKDWCDFEELIMDMDFKCLENYITEEDFFNIGEVVSDLPGLFFEWIASINLDSISYYIPSIKYSVDRNNDLALVFNYTETLEKVYGVKKDNICYIHGKRKREYVDVDQQYMWSYGENNQGLIVGGMWKDKYNHDEYKGVRGELVKDTDVILFHNEWFFERICKLKINRVYSYGFSFSEVDQPYIRKVCESINDQKKTEWINYVYKNENRYRCINSLRSAGYKGKLKQIFVGEGC